MDNETLIERKKIEAELEKKISNDYREFIEIKRIFTKNKRKY